MKNLSAKVNPVYSCLLFHLFLAICLLLSACKQKQANEPVEKDETGIVVPGQGMDGVKLGDSKETVIKKLGQPTSGGPLDGIYRSWHGFNYMEGPHAALHLRFLEESDGSFGPLDGISATSPYNGKTKEGIGIGSVIKMMHDAYGLPVYNSLDSSQNVIFEYYCLGDKEFHIHYEDSTAVGFFIGYYKPMPEDPYYPCK